MRKEVADKWVKALRSGKYNQGKENLKKDGKFCCLGVLCNISKLATFNSSPYFDNELYMGSPTILPEPVRQWAGMRSCGGMLKGGNTLTFLNDTTASFTRIADIIEKHWQEL